MVDWQVTATTIYCDDVADEVTIIVHRDGSARCVWFARRGERGGQTPCPGPECHLVVRYREQLFAEEANTDPAGSAERNGSE